MIEREDRLKLNTIFKERKEIFDNMNHNREIINKLEVASKAEPSAQILKAMERKIRGGKELVSTQKTALMKYSMQAIARRTGLARHVVSHHHSLFNECGYTL